ncbi:MAG: ABC transporter ATP-binding protein [Bacilli bacterium]|nr:ABC transporter ATP-binding protein [Bacilli bacterium]
MIELNNVSKKYNNRYVLKDISLTFPRYGLVIINGPSGCGKTTLLNILSTLLNFSGDISFDGKSYQNLNDDEKELIRSRKLGFLFQDYKLFENESVKSNIELAIDIACGDKKTKKEKRIKDLLRLVGLSRKEKQIVNNLSGGEKQRVALARAIANSPLILLADEPTGNLDEYNTKVVMDLLNKISSSALVIMVSHDLKLSEEYADQIIRMNDGKYILL